jgi:hypothetical protein
MVMQIQCIKKSNRPDPHERITHIGGVYPNGVPWKFTQEEAIQGIEAKQYAFYASVQGKSVWVVVAISRYGHKYLKTEADGEHPNNLLNLPECP